MPSRPFDERNGEPILSTAATTTAMTTTTVVPRATNSTPTGEETGTVRWWESRAPRWIVFVGVASVIVWVTIDLSRSGDGNSILQRADSKFIIWLVDHPDWGVLAVIIVYIVATVCFVPGSILTIGTSFAFGRAYQSTLYATSLSSLAVFIGASLGSIACFLLGRYLFRDGVERLAGHYPIILAFDRAMLHNGFYIMLLLRLSPLVPYNALDYMSGITSISLFDYTLAMIGLLPGTILFCFIGATASDLTTEDGGTTKLGDIQTIMSIVIGLFFAGASIGLASYYSKIELEKLVEERDGAGGYQRRQQTYDSLSDEDHQPDDGIEATFEAA